MTRPTSNQPANKHISWKSFLVERHSVEDVNGNLIYYQVPPSWRLELQLWDLLETAFSKSPDLNEVFSDDEVVLDFVALALGISKSDVEERLDSESIESTFLDVWNYIAPTPDEIKTANEYMTTIEDMHKDLFSHAIAMFAVECGWFPDQILDLPKVQVSALGAAISTYLSDRMKFQASIHGAKLEGDESAPDSSNFTKLDDEAALRGLQLDGLPIEIT